jgi:hypothetical protein
MEEVIRYVVTVKAVVERVEKLGKSWEKTTAAPDAPYAYTPEIEKTVQREVQVFEQRVNTLDMAALVSIVNGLSDPRPAVTPA